MKHQPRAPNNHKNKCTLVQGFSKVICYRAKFPVDSGKIYDKVLWGIYVLLVLGIDASLIGLQCYTVFKLYHGVKVDDFGFWILDFGFSYQVFKFTFSLSVRT